MTYINAKRRKKAATVVVGGKPKFPIDSEETAESALHLIHNAKPPLTGDQQAKVRRKAARFGASDGGDAKKTPKKGKK